MKKTILKNTSIEIAKLMFFIWLGFFVTLILSYTPIVNLLNNIFAPLLNFFGLSKKTTVPILFAITGNIYLALGSALIFTFKIKQWLIMGLVLSLSQSLIPFALKSFQKQKQIFLFIITNLLILVTVTKIWNRVLFGLDYKKQIGISTQIASLKGGDTILITSIYMYIHEILRISIYALPIIVLSIILQQSCPINKIDKLEQQKPSQLKNIITVLTGNYRFAKLNNKNSGSLITLNKYVIIYLSSNILLETALFFPYLKFFALLIIINKLIVISLITLIFSKLSAKKA